MMNILERLLSFDLRRPYSSKKWSFPQLEMQIYRKEMQTAYNAIEKCGQSILGQGVEEFENKFAIYLGGKIRSRQVLGVGNGTDAIELALYSCNIEKGDLVAVPSHTAYATVAAILRTGGCPIFVDLEPDKPVMSPRHLKEVLTTYKDEKIRAVIAVHLYGECCNLKDIKLTCEEFHLPLIEDCAQACGSQYENQYVGTFGDYACFSFYPTKNLACCGDGGALVIRDHGEDLEYCRRLRLYGWDKQRQAVQLGVNSRLDALQAVLLSKKLKDLPRQIKARRRIADQYYQNLRSHLDKGSILSLPSDGINWNHSYNLYVIQINPEARSKLLDEAAKLEIPLAIHYEYPCHLQPYLQPTSPSVNLPETMKYCSSIVTLPIHPYLSKSQVDKVCDLLHRSL